MPRPDLAGSVALASERLIGSITALVQNLQAAVTSAPTGRVAPALTASTARTPGTRGPGKGNPKLKTALKKSWASYTPAQRAERVRKMLAGRGLKPNGVAKKPAAKRPAVKEAKSKPAAKGKGGAWASMSPEQRAERMAKMRAGRGLRAKRG